MNYPVYTHDVVQAIETGLRQQGFKDERNGNWRGNHPGGEGRGLRVTISQAGNGKWSIVYSDHARGGEGGGVKALAEMLQVTLPEPEKKERGTAEQTKRSYRDLAEYAQAHGVTRDVLLDAGWADVSMIRDNGKERPALTFKTLTGTRFRFIDGEKPYYKSVYGYKASWYALSEAVKLAKATGQPLTLCNGEISTVVAQHFGIAATALTGGEKRLPDAYVKELLETWNGDILLAFDCDEAGRKTAEAVKQQIPRAQIIDLMLTDGGDLADLCKLYTTDAAARLKTMAQEQQKPAETAPIQTHQTALADVLREIEIAKKKAENGELIGLIARAQLYLDSLHQSVRPVQKKAGRDLVAERRIRLEAARKDPRAIRGLECGIKKLDQCIGGFTADLISIYGPTNMGKSTLAASITSGLVKVRHKTENRNLRPVIIPTEMDSGSWLDKMVAAMASIPVTEILRGSLDDNEARRVEDAYRLLEEVNPIFLDDPEPSPRTLKNSILEAVIDGGGDFVILDSISNLNAGFDNIYQNTSSASRTIQLAMIELRKRKPVPIIQTVQVDTTTSKSGKWVPRPEDARGGGDIGRDSNIILSLYYEWHLVEQGRIKAKDAKFPQNCALVRVAKHTWGAARSNGCRLYFKGGAGFWDWDTETVTPAHDIVSTWQDDNDDDEDDDEGDVKF